MKLSASTHPGILSSSESVASSPAPGGLLLVSEKEQSHILVRKELAREDRPLCSRFSLREAREVIASGIFPVILCDCDLSSGSWRDLLEIAQAHPRPPRFVVFSRSADVGLWAEVLNAGAYDLLTYPFELQELTRVTSLAWDSWLREGLRPDRPAAVTLAAPAPQLESPLTSHVEPKRPAQVEEDNRRATKGIEELSRRAAN